MFESLNVMSGYFSAAAHVSVVPEPAATGVSFSFGGDPLWLSESDTTNDLF